MGPTAPFGRLLPARRQACYLLAIHFPRRPSRKSIARLDSDGSMILPSARHRADGIIYSVALRSDLKLWVAAIWRN